VRFIIPELPYEQPLAKGLWRYEQDGTPTGAVEHWRLSAAQDGYHFLRVDLDARSAPSGRSYLFHAVLDETERFVRLKYRLWQENSEVIGNVHLEEDAVLFTSGPGEDRGGSRIEEILNVPAHYKFWFPASTALGFLARSHFDNPATAVTLVVSDNKIDDFQLLPLVTTVERIKPGIGSAQDPASSPIRLFWEDQQRAIWLDSFGWPRRVARQDGMEAVETQLVHYQRINKPGEQ
jgi:hypothetical protein